VCRPVAWTQRPLPSRVRLAGRDVHLDPLAPIHAEALYAALCRPEDAPLWTYRMTEMPSGLDALATEIDDCVSHPADVTFVIAPHGGEPAGMATLMRADPKNGVVEVGSILFGYTLQRTRAATEAMTLLAGYVFDELGYRRYEWKCDSLNEPSRVAAIRLGFVYEGRFRNALVYKGRNRDTDWFSITDADWLRIRAAYDAWLDPANFDAEGRQRVRLADFRDV
jgi:RimJ/RimL family protein N-acetyltransferase